MTVGRPARKVCGTLQWGEIDGIVCVGAWSLIAFLRKAEHPDLAAFADMLERELVAFDAEAEADA